MATGHALRICPKPARPERAWRLGLTVPRVKVLSARRGRAVGLTSYFCAQYAVLNYVRRFKHITPLWFANVANNILWWTFVKACWRAAGSMMANRGITFKTTMKARAQTGENSQYSCRACSGCLHHY